MCGSILQNFRTRALRQPQNLCTLIQNRHYQLRANSDYREPAKVRTEWFVEREPVFTCHDLELPFSRPARFFSFRFRMLM